MWAFYISITFYITNLHLSQFTLECITLFNSFQSQFLSSVFSSTKDSSGAYYWQGKNWVSSLQKLQEEKSETEKIIT